VSVGVGGGVIVGDTVSELEDVTENVADDEEVREADAEYVNE
jgi:hypothetical protein